MSLEKPKKNYTVQMTDSTGQVVIPKPIRPDEGTLYITETADDYGNPVLLYHTYDYSLLNPLLDEAKYTRKFNGRQTTIPAEIRDDSWDEFVIERHETQFGVMFALYPSSSESTQGE